MVFSVASHKEEGSSSTPTPPIPVFDLPEEIVETIRDLTFEKRAKLCYKMFLTILLKNHWLCIKGLRFTQTTHSSTSSTSMTYGGQGLSYHLKPLMMMDQLCTTPHIGLFMTGTRLPHPAEGVKENSEPFYADTRSLMARANGVNPDNIPYYVMWNISVWSKDHLDAYKWIEANGQWLYDNFDHCKVETSNDDDDARSLVGVYEEG
ncbi:hypothetical protein Tco_1260492 [Tanacetum coccineum]